MSPLVATIALTALITIGCAALDVWATTKVEAVVVEALEEPDEDLDYASTWDDQLAAEALDLVRGEGPFYDEIRRAAAGWVPEPEPLALVDAAELQAVTCLEDIEWSDR